MSLFPLYPFQIDLSGLPQVSEKKSSQKPSILGVVIQPFSTHFSKKVMVFQPFQPQSGQANKHWFWECKKNQRMGVKMEEKD